MQRLLEMYGYESYVIPYPALKLPEKTEKQKRVVFMGRLTKAKGADLIAPLAEMLHKDGYEIDVIGRGPLSKVLENKEGIKLHGFLGDERFEILKKTSLLFAPSRWPEPFGIIALEAASYGIPTITLEGSGGLAELVEKEGIGKVCKEEDVIESVISLLRNGRDFEHACFSMVEKFEKTRILEEFKKVLKAGLKP